MLLWQAAFTCSKLAAETVEQNINQICFKLTVIEQRQLVVLVASLLTFN